MCLGRSWGDANISSKIFEQKKHHPRIQNATHDWVPFKDDLFVISYLLFDSQCFHVEVAMKLSLG